MSGDYEMSETNSVSVIKPITMAMEEELDAERSATNQREYGEAPESVGSSSNISTYDANQTELLTNVCRYEQLANLPEEFLSGDATRPLQNTDDSGNIYRYALQPMCYSVLFILIVEALERFSYYGVSTTQTSYLMGTYDPKWNANMTSVSASTYVSTSTAIAYSVPFLGAILADCVLGDYWTIVIFAILFYIPGLLLIALTSIHGLLGSTFNMTALTAGLLALYPIGAGGIKSVVNIFGAKQYHSLLQVDMIETYYVRFYMCINSGGLIGGIAIPIVAQHNITVAYIIPAVFLCFGVIVFLLGTPRFVRPAAQGKLSVKSLKILCASVICCSRKKNPLPEEGMETGVNSNSSQSACCKNLAFSKPSLEKTKISEGGKFDDMVVDNLRLLLSVFPISLLIVPFNVAYAQMSTTFVVQGTVMKNAGFIDASFMQNADAISVLIVGFLVSSFFYPALSKRGIKMETTHKYALGTFFSTLSIISAIIVDWRIRAEYKATGQKISIMWQVFSFVLIGAGEIFAVSAAYEAAFMIAPTKKKALASAINLFCIGGLPNFISSGLFNACGSWFTADDGTQKINTIHAYCSADVIKYFFVLLGITIFGTVLCLIPHITSCVSYMQEQERQVKGNAKEYNSKQNEDDHHVFNSSAFFNNHHAE